MKKISKGSCYSGRPGETLIVVLDSGKEVLCTTVAKPFYYDLQDCEKCPLSAPLCIQWVGARICLRTTEDLVE